jgi:hypothetical protein
LPIQVPRPGAILGHGFRQLPGVFLSVVQLQFRIIVGTDADRDVMDYRPVLLRQWARHGDDIRGAGRLVLAAGQDAQLVLARRQFDRPFLLVLGFFLAFRKDECGLTVGERPAVHQQP